jgi:hypothetical protein
MANTRVIYRPIAAPQWQHFLGSNIQYGQGLAGYKGLPYQRGYGIFSSILKLAKPLVKSVFKSVAKEGIKTAANIGSDVLEGHKFKDSVKSNVGAARNRLVRKGTRGLLKKIKNQRGKGGVGYMRKPKWNKMGKNMKKRGWSKMSKRKVRGIKINDFLGTY